MEGQILRFLKSQPDKAFRITEILSGLGYQLTTQDFTSALFAGIAYLGVNGALENLVKRGQVKAKRVKAASGEDVYYMAFIDKSKPILRSKR